MEKQNKFLSVRTMVYLAILVALDIVLSRFLSFSMWNMKIGFTFVPLIISAKMFGAKGAVIQAGLGDFLGAVLFPIGPYFPGFTLTAMLNGLLFACFLKNPSKKNIVILVLLSEIVCSLIINSFWISVLYGSPYMELLGTRIMQVVIMSIVKIAVIPLVLEIEKIISKSTASIRR